MLGSSGGAIRSISSRIRQVVFLLSGMLTVVGSLQSSVKLCKRPRSYFSLSKLHKLTGVSQKTVGFTGKKNGRIRRRKSQKTLARKNGFNLHDKTIEIEMHGHLDVGDSVNLLRPDDSGGWRWTRIWPSVVSFGEITGDNSSRPLAD